MGKAPPNGKYIEYGCRYPVSQAEGWDVYPGDLWNPSPKISCDVELLLLGLRIVG
jgi:hypothetical protein